MQKIPSYGLDVATQTIGKSYSTIPDGNWVLWLTDKEGKEDAIYYARELRTLIIYRDNHANKAKREEWPYRVGGYTRMYVKGE